LLSKTFFLKLSPNTPYITYIFNVPGKYEFRFNYENDILSFTVNVVEHLILMNYFKHGHKSNNEVTKVIEKKTNLYHYIIHTKTTLFLSIKIIDKNGNLYTKNDISIIPYTIVSGKPVQLKCKIFKTTHIEIINGIYEVTLMFEGKNKQYSKILWLKIESTDPNIVPLRFPEEYEYFLKIKNR